VQRQGGEALVEESHVTISEFLVRLDGVSRGGDDYLARCPGHDDKRSSLSVCQKGGKVLIHCFAGCDTVHVLAALDLTLRDLFLGDDAEPPKDNVIPLGGRRKGGNSRIVAVYDYRDADGTLLFQAVRFSPKSFRRRRPNGKGGWIWKLEDATPRVLYRLPEIQGERRVVFGEGEKDVDNLWKLGIPATTNIGGAEAFAGHADDYMLQLVSAGITEVVVCPDNDAAGWKLMRAVAAAAHGYGLRVRWLALPGLGEKMDVSDWLDAGHTKDEFLALVEAAPVVTEAPALIAPATGSESPRHASGYVIDGGRICRERIVRGGTVIPEPLCNFTAEIAEELVLDDGSGEPKHAWIVEGALESGVRLPRVRVPAAKFSSLGWVLESWGARAIPAAGQGAKEHLRVAVQQLSRPRRRHLFTHTGWRQVEGRWAYLSATGAIGADDVEVELEGRLATYALPREPRDPAAGLRQSLALLGLGPLEVTWPLWGATFAATLGEWLPVTYSIWIEGQSNSLKTSTALVFLSHFGRFDDARTLPAAWVDTPAALEQKLFVIKDAPLLIDDFVRETEDADTKAIRALRSQGNRVSRSRMTRDLTRRPDCPPRGLLLATAEHRPHGVSLAARTLVIPFRPGMIARDRLTAAQKTAARLPHAMAGFLAWLAPQIDDGWRQHLREAFEDARARARREASLLRVPEVAGHLWVGIVEGLRYAEALGVLSPERHAQHREEAWTALLGARSSQDAEVESQRETRVFLEALWGALAAHQVTLLGRDDGGTGYAGRAVPVGWEDATHILLNWEAAYQLVARVCRDSGRPLRLQPQGLVRALRDDRLLVPGEGDNLRRRMRVAGQAQRVVCLLRETVAAFTEEPGWLGRAAPNPEPDWVTEGPADSQGSTGQEDIPF
jgi:hypothetical protein